jgi:hypothetical protein
VPVSTAKTGESGNDFSRVRRDVTPAHDILGGEVSRMPHDNLPPVEERQTRKGLDFLGGFAMCIHVQISFL